MTTPLTSRNDEDLSQLEITSQNSQREIQHITQIKHIAFSVPEKPMHGVNLVTSEDRPLHQNTTDKGNIITDTFKSTTDSDDMLHVGLDDDDLSTTNNDKLGTKSRSKGQIKGLDKSEEKQRMQRILEARKLAKHYLNLYLQEQKASHLKTNWG